MTYSRWVAVSTLTTLGPRSPFERILVDTAVVPDPEAVSGINPRITPGETRRVLTGIPGKTGVVYTLDGATGEFLWVRPTVTQNVISAIDGATGDVIENAEVVFTAEGRIPDFPVTRSHPPASWPSAANSSICLTYRKTAGEESRRRSPVANRWMRP